DVVALNQVAGRAAAEPDAVIAVAGDHVVSGRRAAADGVTSAATIDGHAAVAVAQRGRARGAKADDVALDQVAGRGGPRAGLVDGKASGRVARDEVARSRGRAPDGVAGRPVTDLDAIEG